MQRFHTLRIATLTVLLCAAACGDDDDNQGTPDGGGQDSGATDGGKDASTSTKGKDSGTTDSGTSAKDAGNTASGLTDASALSDDDGGEIELLGSWSGMFGDETIDNTMWNGAQLIEYDNAKNFAITQNAANAMFDPGKYNKNVWTEPVDDTFYYCTVDFSLATAADAIKSTKTADDSDLDGKGCGGFPWTKLKMTL